MPLALAEIGKALYGPRWVEPMAVALGVSEQDVIKWDVNPEAMPLDLADEIDLLGSQRIQEIQMILGQVEAVGIKGLPAR
jgi:hypothetical protein